MRACPGEAELERLASIGGNSTDRADRSLLRHVERCSSCSARLETVRANNRFLAHAGGDLAEALNSTPARATSTPVTRPLPEPGTVPGFQIIEEIGHGGQGVVYRAVQIDTRRPAAIKMLLAGAFATSRQLHRFEREIELAAGLRHPNIVTVFQSGVAADGGRYVAMEFVRGVPLDQFVAETLGPAAGTGRDRADAIVRLMLQVARGVGHAHTAGVIHRDIKPGNILIDPQGVPRVLDFGLARTIATAGATQTLVTQDFAGTPAYAAPEQLSADHETTDARGDVYTLGVVLYRLWTGTAPYPCDGPLAVVVRHVAETPPTPPSRHVPRLPADLQTIVLRCLAKDPERRYASASALAEDLEDYLAGQPISARRDSATYVLCKLILRNRAISAAAAVVAITVLLAAVGFALLAADMDRSRRDAEAALADSTVQRARMMAISGDPKRAETLLWVEAKRAGVTTGDEALWSGTPERRRSIWSLAEFYARLPRMMHARTDGLCSSVGFDIERQELWALHGDGSRSTWSLDGQFIEHTSALTPWAETATASPNGRFVVLQGEGQAQVWDAKERVAIAPPFACSQPAYYARIDDEANVIAYGNIPETGALLVADARSGAVLAQLDPMISGYVVRTSAAGEVEVLAGTRTMPVPQLLAGRSPDWRFEPLPGIGEMMDASVIGGIRNVTPNRDGRLIALSVDCHLYLFERSPEPTLVGHAEVPTKGIDRLAFDEREGSIIVAGRDGLLARFAVPGLEQRALLHTGNLPFALASAETPPLAALAMMDGGVAVYAASKHPWVTTIESTPYTHASVDVSMSGALAWGDDAGKLHILPRIGDEPLVVDAHDRVVTSVAFSPNGERIVTASFDGAIREWSIDGEPIREIAAGLTPISSARYSPDGRSIASGQTSGTVHVWRDGQPALELLVNAYRVPMVAFSPDGRLLLCAVVNPDAAMASIFDLTTGTKRYELGGHGIAIRAVAWSVDGTMFATAGDDRTVRIWSAADGLELQAITGLPWGPYGIAFHPEGSVLFAVGPGGSVIVADPLAGVELATLPIHERHVFSIVIGPDGATLYTSGEDSWIGVTDLHHLLRYIRGNEAYWRSQGSQDEVTTPD
ncbi:MAG: protein kinase [Phycisphaera sp.]|nr:MAG: protein kinase [Phycisphaera sp.]